MIHLKNGTFIDWKTLEFKTADVFVEEGPNGKILFEKPQNLQFVKNLQIIDCTGKLITKSFGNGHHHVYSSLARGMTPPKIAPSNFEETLKYIWWPLDKSLTREMVQLSALTTAIACAKRGCTFVIDHHASPNYLKGSLEIIAQAFDLVGVSHLLCYEITDRYGNAKTQEAFDETRAYSAINQVLVGLHASFTVGDETLKNAVELASKLQTGIHIHVAEDTVDQYDAQKNYKQSVGERLYNAGAFELNKNIFAHCLHLSDTEKELISLSNTYVAINTDSNLNNRVGSFNPTGIGQKIMLGTDGMHSDMLRSARITWLEQNAQNGIQLPTVYQWLRNVHHYINQNGFIGDGDNNLIVLDYDSPTEVTSANFVGHVFYGLESRHIQHVISSGKLIVENYVATKIDETVILQESRKLSTKLWKLMQQNG
jgi:cytosine/adenosine deaminase-related metal-dependent hydrolase